ncbi:MAG: DeoR/GlpR family DNA-binding transcription regulator [Dictyoglomus sp.]|uniref:DeoR/GlpR family DNA-binding transcription regulator n=1 Tax=Dictyoglomus sp. TaxID=28205 RepID=UPI003D153141
MKEYRFERILKLIREKGYLTVQEIAKELSISEITVRRDLNFLEKQGLIKRVRGGATATSISSENSFFLKLEENKEIKKEIAKKALSLLKDGSIIAMSGGSTIYYMVQALDQSPITNLTILTNSITTAWAVINLRKNFRLIHSGGTTKEKSFECIGGHVIKFFQEIGKIDYYFFGANGVDIKNGITFFDMEEAEVAKTIISKAEKKVLVADSSKFNLSVPFKVCNFDDLDYIVSDSIPEEFKKIPEWSQKFVV